MNCTTSIDSTSHLIVQKFSDTNLTTLSTAIISILQNTPILPQQFLPNPSTLWDKKNVHFLEMITVLDLRDLDLQAVPAEIGKLNNLEDLDLSSNSITSLPEEVGELKNLIQLSLNNNQFTTIPDVVYKLERLRGLYLSNNKISQFNSQITQLTNLKWLYLNDNLINQLPIEATFFFEGLIKHSVENNPIKGSAQNSDYKAV